MKQFLVVDCLMKVPECIKHVHHFIKNGPELFEKESQIIYTQFEAMSECVDLVDRVYVVGCIQNGKHLEPLIKNLDDISVVNLLKTVLNGEMRVNPDLFEKDLISSQLFEMIVDRQLYESLSMDLALVLISYLIEKDSIQDILLYTLKKDRLESIFMF